MRPPPPPPPPPSPPPPQRSARSMASRRLHTHQWGFTEDENHEANHGTEFELGLELDSAETIGLDDEERAMMIDLDLEDEKPRCPSSPPGPPSSIHVDPAMSLEEWSSDEENDPYFNSLVDNFVAAIDVDRPLYSDDYLRECSKRNSILYAETALKHYNSDEKNKVKYELINVIKRCDMMEDIGFYSHVNFVAMGNQQKEELFFAEVLMILMDKGCETYKTTCVLPLEGGGIGGLCGTVGDSFPRKFKGGALPIDEDRCYGCREGLMHPKNVPFEAGHVAFIDYYHGG